MLAAERAVNGSTLLPEEENPSCVQKFLSEFYEEFTGEEVNPLFAAGSPKGLVCVSFLLLLHVFVMVFACFVFSIQGLVVGTQTFQDGGTTDTTSCTFHVGLWMIVYGSAFYVLFFFGWCIKDKCCTVPKTTRGGILNCLYGSGELRKVTGKKQPNMCFMFIGWALSLFILGWKVYGMVLLYTQTGCDPSQFQVFSLMVQFLFYGEVIFQVLKCTTFFYLSYMILFFWTKD